MVERWRRGQCCSLEYDDLIVDGVYDIWGEFREFRSPEGQPTFPTLMELAALKPGPDDMREVVLVNHDKDPGLCEAEERAAEAINSLCEQGPIPCVQVEIPSCTTPLNPPCRPMLREGLCACALFLVYAHSKVCARIGTACAVLGVAAS